MSALIRVRCPACGRTCHVPDNGWAYQCSACVVQLLPLADPAQPAEPPPQAEADEPAVVEAKS